MKSLTINQMSNSNGGDAWLDIAAGACGVWAFGKFFLGATISCAASPLAGYMITQLVDGACAVVAVAALVQL